MAEEKEVLQEEKDLNETYGSGRKAFAAVQNANFQIYKGETFGLVGESGSGKTTIGRAILRILPTSGGEILYKGQKINGKIPRALDSQVTREIQMIFQDPQSSLNERAKVSYIVGEGLQNVRPDLTAAQREERVRQALRGGAVRLAGSLLLLSFFCVDAGLFPSGTCQKQRIVSPSHSPVALTASLYTPRFLV